MNPLHTHNASTMCPQNTFQAQKFLLAYPKSLFEFFYLSKNYLICGGYAGLLQHVLHNAFQKFLAVAKLVHFL